MNFILLKERPPLLKASTQSMILSRTEESDGDAYMELKKAMELRQTQPLTWNQNVKIVSQRIVRNF